MIRSIVASITIRFSMRRKIRPRATLLVLLLGKLKSVFSASLIKVRFVWQSFMKIGT